MDGIGIIITLVLSLVIAVVQQLLKRKKQRQNETVKTEKGSGEPPLKQTWKELFGADDPFDFGTEIEPEPTSLKYAADPGSDISTNNTRRSRETKYMGQSTKNPYGRSSEQKIGDINLNEDTAGNNIIKDFDIRKAVIYTEIMTPKFKE